MVMVRRSKVASTLAALNAVKHSYQVKRKPICWLRIGSETLVICPGKDEQVRAGGAPLPGGFFFTELQFVTSPPGFAQLATFNALKTSQRSWSFRFSRTWKFLSKPQSAVNRPGPRSELRLAFPNV